MRDRTGLSVPGLCSRVSVRITHHSQPERAGDLLYLGAVGTDDLLESHVEFSEIIHKIQDREINPQREEAAVPLDSQSKVQTSGNPVRYKGPSSVR